MSLLPISVPLCHQQILKLEAMVDSRDGTIAANNAQIAYLERELAETKAHAEDLEERVIPTLLGRIDGLRAGAQASLVALANQAAQILREQADAAEGGVPRG